VIGAGPYGLAIGAHLRERRALTRVFGDPMASWSKRMPSGMFLKSTPSASSISAPRPGYSLEDFCIESGIEPFAGHRPVPVEQFVRYGTWFCERLVPQLEQAHVVQVERQRGGFAVSLDSGEELLARAVIVASGFAEFAYVPPELADIAPAGPLPSAALSHSGQHHDLSAFAGKRVAVIGAGQSALETAALLYEADADVQVLVRGERAIFGEPPTDIDHQGPGTLLKPESPLGPGWSHLALSRGPAFVRSLPLPARRWLVANILGPSGAWWLRERVEGRLPIFPHEHVGAARLDADGVVLDVVTSSGRRSLTVDHVIAATGYRVSIGALEFLSSELRTQIACEGTSPRLGSSFESSVPGLYFSGLAAAPTFGPLMRFVAGTTFAARRISATLN
jgi:cation diffusion facilitator CzcD-associated flavoprotein CzcO